MAFFIFFTFFFILGKKLGKSGLSTIVMDINADYKTPHAFYVFL